MSVMYGGEDDDNHWIHTPNIPTLSTTCVLRGKSDNLQSLSFRNAIPNLCQLQDKRHYSGGLQRAFDKRKDRSTCGLQVESSGQGDAIA